MSQVTPQPPGSPTPAHSPRGLLRIGLGKTPLRVDWEPPSPEELQRNLLQYEIAGMLGRGGMGAVYRARQTALDRAVAIKLLPIEESVDDDFAERFRREARAMARLEHPNIVQVFDSGTTSDGCLFFVMALVDGTTLHQAIHPSAEKGGSALTPDAALAIAGQVCDALSHAHAEGIVHRDIKPSNVMVARDGKVKVADFGIARVAEPGTGAGATTVAGTVMGTPNYMAPEQMNGVAVDHRADIFALGVMLYEALTGELPRGVFEPPSRRVKVNKGVDALVARAMHAKPEDRFQTAAEMKQAIERAHAALRPRKKHGSWRKAAALAAVLTVAVTAWKTGLFAPRPAPAPPAPPAPEWRLAQTIETTEHVRFARFHPRDGTVWISDGVNSLLRVRTDGQQERVRDGNFYNAVFLPGAADAMLLSIHYPAVVVRWSPNGPQIPLDIRFDPGEHPSALAVAPADWRGGSGFQPGDLLLTTGSDKEPEHIWRLRDGVPPLELEPKNGVPAGFFDAAFSRDAIYLTHTGGFKGHPEDDAILRLNADTIQPVQITPPLSELVPGTRGAMSIACDRATGDLFVAIPSLDAKNIDHPVRLLHLRPVDGGAQKFTATIVTTPEIRRTARFALDLSPDARRLAVTDDNARRVFIFERK